MPGESYADAPLNSLGVLTIPPRPLIVAADFWSSWDVSGLVAPLMDAESSMSAFARALSEPGESIRQFTRTLRDAEIALRRAAAIGAPTVLRIPDRLRSFLAGDDAFTLFVAQVRQIARQVGRGREFFAVLLLLSPATNRDDVAVVVRWLVDHTPWKLWSDGSRVALHERADGAWISAWEVRQQELTAGVYLALATLDQPRRYRRGSKWLRGDDGRVREAPPIDLAWDDLLAWLRNAARQAATASLLDRPFPTLSTEVMDRRTRGEPLHVSLPAEDLIASAEPDPLARLVDRENADEDARRVAALLEVATPRQRELLPLLAAGMSEAEAARHLGIAPNTARVQIFRLRKRVA